MLYSTKLRRWVAIGWTIFMFLGLSWPKSGLPDLEGGQDKWMHWLIFGAFGAGWVWAGKKPVTILLAGFAYAWITEIWQGVMPINRTFDLYDILADTIGTFMGVGIGILANKLIPARG